MKTRQEIKTSAKEAMRGQRGTAILLGLVFGVLALPFFAAVGIVALLPGGIFVSPLLGWAGLLIVLVLTVNLYGAYVKIYRCEEASVGELFTACKVNFGRKLGGMLWMVLWLCIWSLIAVPVMGAATGLIVTSGRSTTVLGAFLMGTSIIFHLPVLIKGLSYSMTTYILADCPNVGARQALRISRRMMCGYKRKLIVLVLSFIGWFLLSSLTFGILYIFYVGPYYYTTLAGFFTEVRERAVADGVVTREEFGMGVEGC